MLPTDYFAILPDPIIQHTFGFLNSSDLLQVEAVSQRWKRLSNDRQIWKLVTYSLCIPLNENPTQFLKLAKDCAKINARYESLQPHKIDSHSFSHGKVLSFSQQPLHAKQYPDKITAYFEDESICIFDSNGQFIGIPRQKSGRKWISPINLKEEWVEPSKDEKSITLKGKPLKSLNGQHFSKITACAPWLTINTEFIEESWFVTGDAEGKICIWSSDQNSESLNFISKQPSVGPVTTLCNVFSKRKNTQYLIGANREGHAFIWTAKLNEIGISLSFSQFFAQEPNNFITDLISLNFDHLAAVYSNGKIKVWVLEEDGISLVTEITISETVSNLFFLYPLVLIGCKNGTLYTWDWNTSQPPVKNQWHQSAITALTKYNAGEIYIGYADGTIQVLDFKKPLQKSLVNSIRKWTKVNWKWTQGLFLSSKG